MGNYEIILVDERWPEVHEYSYSSNLVPLPNDVIKYHEKEFRVGSRVIDSESFEVILIGRVTKR